MKRKNADEQLRALERAAAAGDPQAAKQLHVERRRADLPLLPDKTHKSKRWATENFYFPNGRGVLVASILESEMKPSETERLEREGRPGRYAQVEWDPNFHGGDYDDVGNFAYLELERPYVDSRGLFAVDRLTDDNIEERFEKLTGASRDNIIHYSLDEAYAKDEGGDFWEEDLVEDGIAYVSMGDDKGAAPLGLSYQWPAIRIPGSRIGSAHLDPQVQALVVEIFNMPPWHGGESNPPARRRNMDERLRALERHAEATGARSDMEAFAAERLRSGIDANAILDGLLGESLLQASFDRQNVAGKAVRQRSLRGLVTSMRRALALTSDGAFGLFHYVFGELGLMPMVRDGIWVTVAHGRQPYRPGVDPVSAFQDRWPEMVTDDVDDEGPLTTWARALADDRVRVLRVELSDYVDLLNRRLKADRLDVA